MVAYFKIDGYRLKMAEIFAKHFLDLLDIQVTSFPRRRESSFDLNKLFLFKWL